MLARRRRVEFDPPLAQRIERLVRIGPASHARPTRPRRPARYSCMRRV
jgi:hypothetical protein